MTQILIVPKGLKLVIVTQDHPRHISRHQAHGGNVVTRELETAEAVGQYGLERIQRMVYKWTQASQPTHKIFSSNVIVEYVSTADKDNPVTELWISFQPDATFGNHWQKRGRGLDAWIEPRGNKVPYIQITIA